MHTQICVITGQPLANLIPILHLKPQKIIIVVTKGFKHKSKEFRTILIDLGITQSITMLDGCPDTGLQQIGEYIDHKLLPLLPPEPCDVNITGGTKMHSFSIYEKLRQRGFDDKFIYVDTQNRLLEFYPTDNSPSFNQPLPTVLDAEMTLKGMGKTFIRAESDSEDWVNRVRKYEPLTRWLAQNITDKNTQNLIGDINGLVNIAYKGGKKDILMPKSLQLHQVPKGQAVLLLEQAHDLKLIEWQGGKNIAFSHYDQSRYLTGSWIEQYVWLIAQDIGFEEIYSSLEFGNMGQPTEKNRAKNEIDLFIQHANAALAIECKSATATNNADTSQNMFHKLTGVANRAGGLLCSKLFVSAFSLKQRDGRDIASVYHAKEQNIKVVQSAELIDELPDILRKWKETGRL